MKLKSMDKKFFIDNYQELKGKNNGKKPLYREFLSYCKLHKRKLEEVFGKDAYSKLQEECGDDPNKLSMRRTPTKQILDQYGQLVKELKRVPVAADWIQANLKPTPDAINKIHKLKWNEIPAAFINEYAADAQWTSVIEILNVVSGSSTSIKSNKLYSEIVDRLANWTPNRKRVVEEGYKIELRNYLEKYFNLEEEVGESNPDLLINGKFPIEIKRDPSQSEYDRLLGQMIRHNKHFGSAIAVVTNISSTDRFKKFQKLFIEVHDKLGMTAELINK